MRRVPQIIQCFSKFTILLKLMIVGNHLIKSDKHFDMLNADCGFMVVHAAQHIMMTKIGVPAEG